MTTTVSAPNSSTKTNKSLAVNGGPKAVTAPSKDRWKAFRLSDVLPIAKAIYKGRIADAGGAKARYLETAFRQLKGARFGLAMNSGTAALHSALFAVGVGAGDEVILPSYTWHACGSAILCTGAKPVFCEIEPDTLTLDPNDLPNRVSSRTRAIMPVHVWGNPAQMDKICDFAQQHELKVVEDCSHAHGASFLGKSVGRWGDVGCFSMQGSKAVSGGELGMAICDHARYYDRMLAFGHPVRCSKDMRESDFGIGNMQIGPKYRPHEFALILAAKSFGRLAKLNELRRRNWGLLEDGLRNCQSVRPTATREGAKRGGFLEYKFLVNEKIDVDQFVKSAKAEGIPLNRDRYGSLHELKAFLQDGPLHEDMLTSHDGKRPIDLPVTEEVVDRIVSMPGFVDVSPTFVKQCAEGLAKVGDALLNE